MLPEERDAASLWDMLEAAREAVRFTRGLSFEGFMAEGIVRLATERELEIIGGAARRRSATFRESHPEIPWKDLIGLRNVISHEYDKIDYQRIHDIATRQLPKLMEMLAPLVPPAPE